MTTKLYVLRLVGGHWYIGSSKNVTHRYQEHMNGSGCAWTRKYRPIKLVETKRSVSPYEEDILTKEYMSKYGIDNVRGGSYSMITLSDAQYEVLEQEIHTATGSCFRCGRDSHWVKDCYATRHIDGYLLSDDE